MKLLHLADLHIGKVIYEFSMLEDQRHVLEQVVSIAQEEETDGVILAGDIYDRSVPTAEAVLVLDEFLQKLSRIGQKVFMISGNHDSPERLGFAGSILKKGDVYVEGGFSNKLKSVSLKDNYGRVKFYFLPFARAGAMQKALGLEPGASMEACIRQVIENTKINGFERNILITHHFVTGGGKAPELSDSECPVLVGGTEGIEAEVFAPFDYVALGHIHKPQAVGRKEICYAGSPLKYSFSECGTQKSVVLMELREKGEISIRRKALQPLHDMRRIQGELKELLKEEVVCLADREDYLHVALTDERELFEPMEQLRSCYPNVMQLELLKYARKEGEAAVMRREMKEKTVLEIYQDFYEAVTGRVLDDAREQAVAALLKEIKEAKG